MIAVAALLLAAIPDPSFSETDFLLTASQSTSIVRPTDGTNRFFVAIKSGTIRVIEDGVLLTEPFATIAPIYTPDVSGLVGITVDPDFADNHYVYAFVSVSTTEQQILRYTDRNNVGTEMVVLLSGLPTIGSAHNGGGLGFGHDGRLYFSIGDNSNATGADGDLTLLASKVGRANADGTVPKDNPFADGAGPNNDYIWARGFRNPFSLTIQPSNGALWVADVGSRYEQVFVVGRGDHAGWRNYENNQPAGYITPAIKYRGRASDVRDIVGATRAVGQLTITTAVPHLFRRGEKITLAGLTDASFDGDVYVATASTTNFTALQAGADASTSGGTASTQDLGACVLGGQFYDGTDFPPEYRGNYFFMDHTYGRIFRSVVDADTSAVQSVDIFADGELRPLDLEVGFDGALYLLEYLPGRIYRISYNHTEQKLILSNTYVHLQEGGLSFVGVRLALPPVDTTTVTVRREDGDTDVHVEPKRSFLFTRDNYATPQPLGFRSDYDLDTTDDVARFEVESAGIESQAIDVRVRDFNGVTLVLSDYRLELAEGGTASMTVQLMEMPDDDVVVHASSALPGLSITSGETLTFTPANFDLPQPISLLAMQDEDSTNASGLLVLAADRSAARNVEVTIVDDDARAPAFTSTPSTNAVVGTTWTYHVTADGQPAPQISMQTAPPNTSFEAPEVSFTPSAPGNYAFMIAATNGIAPNATQSFTVVATNDGPPTTTILEPQDNAVVRGRRSDWYGSASDDVSVVRVEFLIDGVVVDTQAGPTDRYLYKGTPVLWDTMPLTDGPHRLGLRAFDNRGQSGQTEITVTAANGIDPSAGAAESGCGCSNTTSNSDAFLFALVLCFHAAWIRGKRARGSGANARSRRSNS